MFQENLVLREFVSEDEALVNFASWLNGKSPNLTVTDVLRDLLQDWFDLERNTEKVFARYPNLGKVGLLTYARGGNGPQARPVFTDHTGSNDPENYALALFLMFLLNSRNQRLRGPCRNCTAYFVQKSARKKAFFCSQRCSRSDSSKRTQQRQRTQERQEKLAQLRKAITKMRWTDDWKRKLAAATNISLNQITRFLNFKEISEPAGSLNVRKVKSASS